MQNHRQTPGDAVGDEWKDTGLFYFSVGYFVQLQYDGFSLPCYILFGSILLLSSRNLKFLIRDRKRDGRGRREELGIVKGGWNVLRLYCMKNNQWLIKHKKIRQVKNKEIWRVIVIVTQEKVGPSIPLVCSAAESVFNKCLFPWVISTLAICYHCILSVHFVGDTGSSTLPGFSLSALWGDGFS